MDLKMNFLFKKISTNVLKKISNNLDLTNDMIKLGKFNHASMSEFELFFSEIKNNEIEQFIWEKGLFSDVIFKDFKLINGKISNVEFYGTQFFNVDFEKVDFQKIEIQERRQPFSTYATLKKVRFINCRFSDVNFFAIRDSDIEFINCDFIGTDVRMYGTTLKFSDSKMVSIIIRAFENIEPEPIKFLNVTRLRLILIGDPIKKLHLKSDCIDFSNGGCFIEEFRSEGKEGIIFFEGNSQVTSLDALFWEGGIFGARSLIAENINFTCFGEKLELGLLVDNCKINTLNITSIKARDFSINEKSHIGKLISKNCIFNEFYCQDSTIGSCDLSWFFIQEKVDFKNTTIGRIELTKTFLGENATWTSENVSIEKLEKFDVITSTKIKIKEADTISGSQLRAFFDRKHFDFKK